ncbi:transposase [Deinococcus aquaedulcis]|uniref:transposase n=1 Tax=Deinococcus aquaedulcis TaxID=2840455 RepID=UPI001C83B767|nr:transposase [Deinococcus aquaedulcis]
MFDKALQTVEQDGVPFCRTPARLARDFQVQPSATTVRRWFHAPRDEASAASQHHTFSGVLCVDEVYQRDKAILLAVDPHSPAPFLATQVIVDHLQPAHLEAFFQRLKAEGVTPRQLVTDESRLYPAVVTKVWPEVTHQRCPFHVAKNMHERLSEVLRTWRRGLPTPPVNPTKRPSLRGRARDQDSPLAQRKTAAMHEVFRLREAGLSQGAIVRITGHGINTVKKWLAGPRPAEGTAEGLSSEAASPPPPGWTSWAQVGQVRNSLMGHKGWLLGQAARWTEEQRTRFAVLLDSPLGEQVRTVRALIEGWAALWRRPDGARPTVAESRQHFDAWVKDPRFQTDPTMSSLVKRLAGKFDHLVPFLSEPTWQGTNNAAERAARAFRRWQRPHYRLRTQRSIERQLAGKAKGVIQPLMPVGRCVRGRSIMTAAL